MLRTFDSRIALQPDRPEWIRDYNCAGVLARGRGIVSGSILDNDYFIRPAHALDTGSNVSSLVLRGNDYCNADAHLSAFSIQ